MAIELRDHLAASCPYTLEEFSTVYGMTLDDIMRETQHWELFLYLETKLRYEWADAMLKAREAANKAEPNVIAAKVRFDCEPPHMPIDDEESKPTTCSHCKMVADLFECDLAFGWYCMKCIDWFGAKPKAPDEPETSQSYYEKKLKKASDEATDTRGTE